MKVYKTTIFALSIVSSLLLFLSVMYSQKFWSELWIIYGFIELAFIVFFFILLIWSIVYWIRNKVQKPFLPFLINIVSLLLIIVLPLNFIRNRVDFFFNKGDYEKAAKLIYNETHTLTDTVYKLPSGYQSLSAGGGDALIVNNSLGSAVFFFTFRGAPDGLKGFLKVINGKGTDVFTKNIGSEITEIKNLGDNWYYISGK